MPSTTPFKAWEANEVDGLHAAPHAHRLRFVIPKPHMANRTLTILKLHATSEGVHDVCGCPQVDPNTNAKLFGKIEDDVPAFFKRLRYPFQISKSSLFAVGSPHTWPGLLASLVWITELLSYVEKAVSHI